MAVTWKKLAYYTDIVATKLDDFTAPDDNTDLNASTAKHGLMVKAVAPAANLMNVAGIVNGETVWSNKAIFDATAAAAVSLAAGTAGTSLTAAHRDHTHLVTASSAPGAAASVLATDASGNVQIVNLGIRTAPNASFPLYMAADADMVGMLEATTASKYAYFGFYQYDTVARGRGYAFGMEPSGDFFVDKRRANADTRVFTILNNGGNVKIAGTAVRGTTEGTNHLDIFDGTAPVGTLTNGCSIYSTAGELRTMDAGGAATLQTPHSKEINEVGSRYWIYDSIDTVNGKRLVIDMEKMMKFLNDHFGLDFIHQMEYVP